MQKAGFVKCLALFLFSTIFLYGVGETYNVEWLQFQILAESNDVGFNMSFSSLIPVLGGLLVVALYEIALKRIV
ncbi:hypothetical protein ACIQ2D_07720 [Lysinibacillus sp. NPDC097287]|uniref:hypothetical protein n=1 Tax=Lysinibacillus sp. NPDC097287 TaxID=3364144 RepID=UPI003822A674